MKCQEKNKKKTFSNFSTHMVQTHMTIVMNDLDRNSAQDHDCSRSFDGWQAVFTFLL